jgi:hypothetical protein
LEVPLTLAALGLGSRKSQEEVWTLEAAGRGCSSRRTRALAACLQRLSWRLYPTAATSEMREEGGGVSREVGGRRAASATRLRREERCAWRDEPGWRSSEEGGLWRCLLEAATVAWKTFEARERGREG